MIICIKDRFEQEGYQIYSKFESIILKGDQGVGSDEVFYLYKEDIDRNLFSLQWTTFHVNHDIPCDSCLLDVVKRYLWLKRHSSLR